MIYPPRAENIATPNRLSGYDRDEFILQPKLDGSAVTVSLDKTGIVVLNRHGKAYTKHKGKQMFAPLQRDSLTVYAGEYMDKSRKDEDGKVFNHVFVIWDILTLDGKDLIGTTVVERLDLLEGLLPYRETSKHIYSTQFDKIYRVASYTNNFVDLYNQMVEVDMYEGCILKRKESKLEHLCRENNNSTWQIKVRKPHRGGIYRF